MAAMTIKLKSWAAWLKKRREALVPVLGLPLFFGVVSSNGGHLTPDQRALVWGLAVVYAALVLWWPPALPDKPSWSITWAGLGRAATIVVPVVLGAVLLLVALSIASGGSGRGGVLPLLLAAILGTVGVAAEGALPVDLFPVLRRRELRRVLYAIVAALFLLMLKYLVGGFFFSNLARGIGRALGETPPDSRGVTAYFDLSSPLRLFLNLLIGAGLFEELLFRVGIMTPIWALTRRWTWGLLVSALFFGLYHISPLSGIGAYGLQTPVITVVESFGLGLATGVIYRYRGFTTAVMVHALGDWLMLMLLA